MMEYIPPEVRITFRDFCVSHLVLRTIRDAFESQGFRADEEYLPSVSGQRRTLVEQFYRNIDWSNIDHALRFLRVLNTALSFPWIDQKNKDDFLGVCRKAGLAVREGQVHLDAGLGVEWFMQGGRVSRLGFEAYIQRMRDGLATDPESAVGAAKDLVEAVAKYVIRETTGQPPAKADAPRLVRDAVDALDLKQDLPEGAKALQKILSGMNQVVQGISEVRNLYGTGHGRLPEEGARINVQHAKLAVGTSVVLATFLLDVLEERQKNVREGGEKG